MRVLDPNNIASSSTTQGKRKAVDDPGATRQHVACKIITSPTASGDSGESNGDVEIGGADLDPGTQGDDTEAEDDAEHAYASTKAMGDADRKVSHQHNILIFF
jgi:hypothetical protein